MLINGLQTTNSLGVTSTVLKKAIAKGLIRPIYFENRKTPLFDLNEVMSRREEVVALTKARTKRAKVKVTMQCIANRLDKIEELLRSSR